MINCVKCGSPLVTVKDVWPTDPSVDYQCRKCGRIFNSFDKPENEWIEIKIRASMLAKDVDRLSKKSEKLRKDMENFKERHKEFQEAFDRFKDYFEKKGET